MINPIHLIAKGAVKLYAHGEEKRYLKQVTECGNNVYIKYPCTITKGGRDVLTIGDESTILRDGRIQLYSYLVNRDVKCNIGKHCYIGRRFTILGGGDVTLEDNVLIADDVMIDSKNHGINPAESTPYMDQPLCDIRDVSIGEGTWIGTKVTILSGVTVGKRCVIGAGAVVTKDIPDYSIALGVPARVVKRFNFELGKWEQV